MPVASAPVEMFSGSLVYAGVVVARLIVRASSGEFFGPLRRSKPTGLPALGFAWLLALLSFGRAAGMSVLLLALRVVRGAAHTGRHGVGFAAAGCDLAAGL